MRKTSQQSAQAAAEKLPMPAGKATVKAVVSADSIILAKTTGKDQFEGMCHLAYIAAPRLGNPNRTEDPFAHEAREAIRDQIIGRKVDFVTEYLAGTKKFVSIKVEGEDIATLLVQLSLAKVNDRR